MTAGSFFGTMDSFGSLDRWVANLNEQAAGTTTIGYKADRTTFVGGVTHQNSLQNGLLHSTAETLLRNSLGLDWSQGSIVASISEWHGAIRGQGFFAVARDLEDGTRIIFTRDGEFHKDADGKLRNRDGYYLVSTADIDWSSTTGPVIISSPTIPPSDRGRTDFKPFSMTRLVEGGVVQDWQNLNPTTSPEWNLQAGTPTWVAGEGLKLKAGDVITSVFNFTGSGRFEFDMRIDKWTNAAYSGDHTHLGLTGTTVGTPKFLITDGGYPGDGAVGPGSGGPWSYTDGGPGIPPVPIAMNWNNSWHDSGATYNLVFDPASPPVGPGAAFYTYATEWDPGSSRFTVGQVGTPGTVVRESTQSAVGSNNLSFNLAGNSQIELTISRVLLLTTEPITVTGLQPGMRAVLSDANGNEVANEVADIGGSVIMDLAALGANIPADNVSFSIYRPDGSLVGTETFNNLKGGDVYLLDLFQFAHFHDPRGQLQRSSLGDRYFESGDWMPTMAVAGTDGVGTFIIGALESANVTLEELTPELALSKHTYEGLTKVLMARISNLDMLLNMIR